MKEISLAEKIIVGFSDLAWGTPLLVLLLGGGLFFMVYSRLLSLRYLRHAVNILRGKYDDPTEPGQINHYQALSTALAATVGMGNVSGVALAIAHGGPGAIFWMWVSAILGVTTKYFTCTLAVMFRGKDSNGELQGGPMYVIVDPTGCSCHAWVHGGDLRWWLCADGLPDDDLGIAAFAESDQSFQGLFRTAEG